MASSEKGMAELDASAEVRPVATSFIILASYQPVQFLLLDLIGPAKEHLLIWALQSDPLFFGLAYWRY